MPNFLLFFLGTKKRLNLEILGSVHNVVGPSVCSVLGQPHCGQTLGYFHYNLYKNLFSGDNSKNVESAQICIY